MNMAVRDIVHKSYQIIIKQRELLKGSIAEYCIAAIVFVIAAIFYTNGVIFDGDSRLFIGEPGDGTAGIVWMMAADRDGSPSFGYTNDVNYPYGVNLGNPLQITSLLISVPLWIITRFSSPFMGVNIMQLIAYTMIALATYFLMKRLTGKWYIAVFAGFAATFFPYHLFKSVVHIGNIFSWVFVFQLATFLYMWRHPSWRSSAFVAIATAAGYYTDGYYLLISSVFALTLMLGLFMAGTLLRRSKSFFADLTKYGMAAAGMTLLLALPIIATQLQSGSQINGTLERSQDTIKQELKVYAATKLDFLLPPQGSLLFGGQSWHQQLLLQKSHRSNPAESNLYIGYVVLVLSAIGVLMTGGLLMAKKGRRWLLSQGESSSWLVVLTSGVVVSAPIMLSFMAPDRIFFLGLEIPSLAGILTDHIALWRVLSRFILPLHILLVVYASFVLYILIGLICRHRKSTAGICIAVAALLMCMLEYATCIYRPGFDLRNMPQVYTYIRNQEDITTLAELPLQDSPIEVSGYYATAQYIHGKKLVNNHVSRYNVGQFSALGDEQNPETIDFLRLRGADAVVVRAKHCHEVDWGTLRYAEKIDLHSPLHTPLFYAPSGNDHLCLYKLAPPKGRVDSSFLMTTSPEGRQDTGSYSTLMGKQGVVLSVRNSAQGKITNKKSAIAIDAFSTGKLTYNWELRQSGVLVAKGLLSEGREETIRSMVDTNNEISLTFFIADNMQYIPGDLRLKNYQSTIVD